MSSIPRLQEVNQLAQAKTGNKSLSKTPSEAIVNLIEALPEKIYLDNRIYLAALFKAHYKPPKASKGGIFDVVARFCGKKDSRPVLNFVYSTGAELIGSNGHVLIAHKFPVGQWPVGYYDPKTGLLRPDMAGYRYPDYTLVIPGANCLAPVDKSIIDIQPLSSSGKNPVLTYKIGAGYYQATYIDIIPASASGWYQEPGANPPKLVAKSPDGSMTIIIMPVRPDSLA